MIRECFPTSVLLGSIERPVEPQVVLDDDVDDNDYYNDDDNMINMDMVVMKDLSQFVSMVTEINDMITSRPLVHLYQLRATQRYQPVYVQQTSAGSTISS